MCESEQALRQEWQQLEQREDESTEAFQCRLQKLVVRSMPYETEREACGKFVIDAFLRGCCDKHAVLVATEKKPETLEDASRLVQEAAQMRKMVLGKKDSYKVKSVEQSSEAHLKPEYMESIVRKTLQTMGYQLEEDQKPSESDLSIHRVVSGMRKGFDDRKPSQSDARCFECGEPGHFARDCPLRRQTCHPYWQDAGQDGRQNRPYQPWGQGPWTYGPWGMRSRGLQREHMGVICHL